MLRQSFRISFRPNDLLFQIIVPCSLGLILGIACIWFSSLLVLGILAATALFMYVTLKRPEIGLLGYLIITSTIINGSDLPRIPIGVGRLLITDIILLAMIGLILIRLLLKSDLKIIHTPLDLPLLAFWGICMFATFLAIGQSSLTVNESLGEVRTVFGYLTFFIVTNMVREERQLRTLLRGMFFLAAVVALAMIVQFLLGNDVQILTGRVETLYTEGVRFMGETRIIPPGESLVFTVFLAITVTMVIDKLQLKKLWMILVFGLTGLGVVLTFKRNLWIAVFIAFFILAVLSSQRVRLRMVGGILLLQIFSLPESHMKKFVTGAFDRLASLTEPKTFENPDSSLRWRDFEYKYAMPKIASNSLIGLGLGSIYRPFVGGKDWVGKDGKGYDGRRFIHNGHLSIIVKSGLLGYLSFLVFSLIALVRGFKFWRRIPNSQLQAVLLGFTLAYLGILIGSIVSPMIITGWWTPVIGIILGINEVILTKVFAKDMGVPVT
jgi:hypothetical protein